MNWNEYVDWAMDKVEVEIMTEEMAIVIDLK